MLKRKGCVYYLILSVFSFLLLGCHFSHHKQKKAEETSAIPVAVIQAKMQKIDIEYYSVGSLASQEIPVIKSLVSGVVTQIDVQEGQSIQLAQELANVDPQSEAMALNEAEAKYLEAQAILHERQMTDKRQKELVVRGIVSKNDYDQTVANLKVAEAQMRVAEQELIHAQYQLARTNIISPIDGQVEKVLISVGEYVSPGTPMFKLINHRKLKAYLPFSEEQASHLHVGQKVHLRSPVAPDKILESKVSAITPSINPENRSMNVIVQFDNDQGWKAGSSIQGHVFAEREFQAITVPVESVVLRPEGLVVFTVKNGKAKEQPVEVGYRTQDYIAIVQGLQPGDIVVTQGADYLNDGAPVDIKENNA